MSVLLDRCMATNDPSDRRSGFDTWWALEFMLRISACISVGIKLSFEAFRVHVADIAKYGTRRTGAVVLAKAPGNTGKTIGISAVQFVFVVQI